GEGVSVYLPGASTVRVHMKSTGPDAVSLVGLDESGRVVLSVASLRLRPVAADQLAAAGAAAARGWLAEVRWVPSESTASHGSVRWAEWFAAVEMPRVPPIVLLDCRGGQDET